MTETEPKTCACAEPVLRVYSVRHTTEHKIQYRRCAVCGLTAGQKRVPSALAERVAALEVEILELRKLRL